MPGLFIVEPTKTLANVIGRSLSAAGYNDYFTCDSYIQAKQRLTRLCDRFQRVILILGTPLEKDGAFDELLQTLNEVVFRNVVTVMMGHQDHNDWENWRRDGQRRFLLYSNFSRLPSLINIYFEKILISETDHHTLFPGDNISILFVDDSATVRMLYRAVLARRGYHVDLAESLAEAEQELDSKQYDLVISDYYLKDGCGDQLCKVVVEKYPDTLITIITASFNERVVRHCLSAGALECSFKEEPRELFLARINAISRLIHTQKKLQAQHQRLSIILDSVGEGVFGVDRQGRMTFCNQHAMTMMGVEHEQVLLGKKAQDLLHPDDQNQACSEQNLQKSYESGLVASNLETVFRRRDDRLVPVECTVSPIFLQGALSGSVVTFRDISQRKDYEQMLREMQYDPLTRFLRAPVFLENLEKRLKEYHSGKSGVLLYMNIDRFSQWLAHSDRKMADSLIRSLTEKIRLRLRHQDMAARIQEDCFAIYLEDIPLTGIYTAANEFREETRLASEPLDHPLGSASASIGICLLNEDSHFPDQLLDMARLACNKAQQMGRDRCHIHLEADQETLNKLQDYWRSKLRAAIREHRISFLAQAITPVSRKRNNLNDQELKSSNEPLLYELLVRLKDEEGKWVSPEIFIPLAEQCGMAQEIDLWVLRQAIRTLEELHDIYPETMFSINLSTQSLQDKHTCMAIRESVLQSRIQAHHLMFEITETRMITNMGNARRGLDILSGLGCHFALDDFGTGYSSITHIKELPAEYIKIDGSFIENMLNDPVDQNLVASVCTLASKTGKKTIAEHVRNAEILRKLEDLGVDYVQGFHIGKPETLSSLKNTLSIEKDFHHSIQSNRANPV